MRTLFLRIFLSFWAAMVLVVVATGGLAWLRFSQQVGDGRMLPREAAERAMSGGYQGLRQWLLDAEDKYPRMKIFVLDPSGVDILKRPLPTPLSDYAERLERAGYIGKSPRRELQLEPEDPLLL